MASTRTFLIVTLLLLALSSLGIGVRGVADAPSDCASCVVAEAVVHAPGDRFDILMHPFEMAADPTDPFVAELRRDHPLATRSVAAAAPPRVPIPEAVSVLLRPPTPA